MAREQINRDKEMAAHLRHIGYPHGRRFTTSNVKFNLAQVGSNKFVRYLESRRARRIK